jgi:hypothetical protein
LYKNLAIAILVGLAGMLAGCALISARDGDKPSPSAGTDCLHPSHWQISFQRSGGFAGQTVNLYLSSDGELNVSNPDQNLEINTTLPQADVDRIEVQLASLCAASRGGQIKSCPDCFVYSLEIEMDGTIYTARADDTTLGASPVKDLFNSLIALLSQTLQAQP